MSIKYKSIMYILLDIFVIFKLNMLIILNHNITLYKINMFHQSFMFDDLYLMDT